MRHARNIAAAILALVCALALACVPAIATPYDGPSADDASIVPEIGVLSDRYESLDSLSSSLTEDAEVVIETRIGVLASVNRALDNMSVRVTGEAIGEALNADADHKWVNLADVADTCIGVYFDDEQIANIKRYGNYHETGTTLKVTGVYHIACPMHQGELDIHATKVEVVDAGAPIEHAIDLTRVSVGACFTLCAVVLIALFLFLRRRDNLRRGIVKTKRKRKR